MASSVAVVASPPAQPGHGLRDRIVERAVARGAGTSAEGPDPGTRFGEVHELEVQGEGRDHGLRGAQVKGIELGLEALPQLGVVGPAQGDRGAPQPLDELVGRLAGLFGDDLAEERAEEPDLDGQRIAGTGRPDAARFGTPRRGAHRPTRPGT